MPDYEVLVILILENAFQDDKNLSIQLNKKNFTVFDENLIDEVLSSKNLNCELNTTAEHIYNRQTNVYYLNFGNYNNLNQEMLRRNRE